MVALLRETRTCVTMNGVFLKLPDVEGYIRMIGWEVGQTKNATQSLPYFGTVKKLIKKIFPFHVVKDSHFVHM